MHDFSPTLNQIPNHTNYTPQAVIGRGVQVALGNGSVLAVEFLDGENGPGAFDVGVSVYSPSAEPLDLVAVRYVPNRTVKVLNLSQTISGFRGAYSFLSNFFQCDIFLQRVALSQC